MPPCTNEATRPTCHGLVTGPPAPATCRPPRRSIPARPAAPSPSGTARGTPADATAPGPPMLRPGRAIRWTRRRRSPRRAPLHTEDVRTRTSLPPAHRAGDRKHGAAGAGPGTVLQQRTGGRGRHIGGGRVGGRLHLYVPADLALERHG